MPPIIRKPIEVIVDKITRPIDHILSGDIIALGLDVIRLNPIIGAAEEANAFAEEIGKLSQYHLYLGNFTEEPLTVIVTPNKDWLIADLGAAVALAALGEGIASAPAGLEAIKNAKTIKQMYDATRILRSASSVAGKNNKLLIWKFYSNIGTVIESGSWLDIYQVSKSNPLNYFNPSQYAAMTGASDVTLTIQLKNGQSAHFNSNSKVSILAGKDGFIKAEFSDGKFFPLPEIKEPGDNSVLGKPTPWDN